MSSHRAEWRANIGGTVVWIGAEKPQEEEEEVITVGSVHNLIPAQLD